MVSMTTATSVFPDEQDIVIPIIGTSGLLRTVQGLGRHFGEQFPSAPLRARRAVG